MNRFGKWTAWLLIIMMLTGKSVSAENAPADDVKTPAQIITEAMEVYSWFTISPLDVDPELPGTEAVFRVADETLCDYDTVMGLLEDNFSTEIIEGMLAYEVYTVIDGVLYGDGVGRGIDPNISDVEYEEISADDQRIVYQVTVHYVGEGENGIVPDVFEFVREWIDNKWVFTQFTFFW